MCVLDWSGLKLLVKEGLRGKKGSEEYEEGWWEGHGDLSKDGWVVFQLNE